MKPAEVYFHLDWKAAFLRWTQATAIVEAKGPRMLPLTGYGDPRADVRIYRVDPLHQGLWPFPASPVVVGEQLPPPFPGEARGDQTSGGRLCRSGGTRPAPAAARLTVCPVVDLPLADKGNTTRFGLDLKPLLDGAVGPNRPGTYLVGLRRLTGGAERSYVRVQVTNLSVTSVEERDRAALYVRALDSGDAVRGAVVKLEGTLRTPEPEPKNWRPTPKRR